MPRALEWAEDVGLSVSWFAVPPQGGQGHRRTGGRAFAVARDLWGGSDVTFDLPIPSEDYDRAIARVEALMKRVPFGKLLNG